MSVCNNSNVTCINHYEFIRKYRCNDCGEIMMCSCDEHFQRLPIETSELLWIFDYWTLPSADLRQYLWAHRPEDVVRARKIIEILPADILRSILKYLILSYWERYLGWPDLLVYSPGEYFFVEVKSSKDQLSEFQKHWINDNAAELHLPFKLVKIHKSIAPIFTQMHTKTENQTIA